jgi:diacylglycerol kinase family enzyme
MDKSAAPQTRSLTPLASIRRVEAVVNRASGGVEPGSDEALQALLAEFPLESRVAAVEPDELDEALRVAVERKPDLLVVFAGDGTASHAAELCGPDGPLLAPLPGGTMNMLSHALYGPRSWSDALTESLGAGKARAVSGGEIDGWRFYCAAILGSPAFWQPAREAARQGRLRLAWRRARFALRMAFLGRLRFQTPGHAPHKAVALSLICPLISRALDEESALEAAGLDIHDAAEAFRLGLNHMLGDWRRDPAATVERCVRGRAWTVGAIPCLIDGELHWLGRQVEFHFVPRAFRALAPPDAEETKA